MEFEEVIRWAEQRKERKQSDIEKYIPVFVIVIVCLLFIAFYLFTNFIKPSTGKLKQKIENTVRNQKEVKSLKHKTSGVQPQSFMHQRDVLATSNTTKDTSVYEDKEEVIYIDEEGNIIPETDLENFEVIEEYRVN